MIAKMMKQGLTAEEAREKIYQDLLKTGDPGLAEALRNYQNQVHPVEPQQQGTLLPPQPD